ncbi:putative pre-16S rRNA nuclease [Endomicrobiia bacterium]|nr:putative pre-16S rRNA nuclease [Endomicrobiia bacterium]
MSGYNVSRIMGVDYGLKRIGIAMTDMLHITSSPFGTIEGISMKENMLKILEIAKTNDVSVIVFGLPVNMNGSEGWMARTVRKVIEEIKLVSSIEVATIDERLTTVQAERILIDEGDVSRKKLKGLKDKIAAALILQVYVDTHPSV